MDTNRCKKFIKSSKRVLEKKNENFCQQLQELLNPRREDELSFQSSIELVLKMAELTDCFMQQEDKLGLVNTNKSDEEKAFVDEYKRKMEKEKQLSEKRLKLLDQMMINAQGGLGMQLLSPTATPEIIDLIDRETEKQNNSNMTSNNSPSEATTISVQESVILPEEVSNELIKQNTTSQLHRRTDERDRENRQRSRERYERARERKSVDFTRDFK